MEAQLSNLSYATSVIELAFPVNVNTFLHLDYTVVQVYDTNG